MEDKNKILKEKIQYLISMSLTEKKFDVISVDVDISTYISQTTGFEPPKNLIEDYYVILVVDYKGSINSFDPYSFTNDIKQMCEVMRDCVSQYTITQNGKIVKGDDNITVFDAVIMDIEFKYEELHKFTVNFKFAYLD